MTVELISRINAKAQDLRMLPPGFDRLSSSDICHAISMFDTKGARLLGRVMYADQPSFAKELQHELLLALKVAAMQEKWHNIAPLAKLSGVAVTIYCAPERCRQCKGIGQKLWGARVVRCQACTRKAENGDVSHGYQRVYFTDIAQKLGITKFSMTRIWKQRYGLAIRLLMKWDEQCWDGFRLALRRKFDNRQRSG